MYNAEKEKKKRINIIYTVFKPVLMRGVKDEKTSMDIWWIVLTSEKERRIKKKSKQAPLFDAINSEEGV